MKLLFVRHGQTDETTKGVKGMVGHNDSLNDAGRAQARKAAQICSEFKPKIVYSSPFSRTKETAEIIAEKCSAELLMTDLLKESFTGEWSKLSIEEGKQKFIDAGMWNYNEEKYEFSPPGGESWKDIHERTDKIIDEAISSSGTDDSVVFVSHNAAMKAMIGKLQGKEFRDWLPVMFVTGSVTAFEFKNDAYTELFANRH